VVIGHGWFHKLFFVVGPITFAAFSIWTSPTEMNLECVTVANKTVRCDVEREFVYRTLRDQIAVNMKAPARVHTHGSGSDVSYSLELNGVSVSMSSSDAHELRAAVNRQRTAPEGTVELHKWDPWSPWVAVGGCLAFLLFGAWAGRSGIVEVDPGTGAVRVLQSALVGPPRVVATANVGDIRSVHLTEDSSGDSTTYGIDLRGQMSPITVIKGVGTSLQVKANKVAELLGVDVS
jgi:hypothetical protein